MSKAPDRPSISMPTLAEDRAITKQKSDNPNQLVSVRYSQEVLASFKSTGDGWQSRMDGMLLKYVARRTRNTQG